MLDKKVSSIKVLTGDPEKDDPTILETLRKDKIKSVKEAQQDIYKKLRGQEFIVPGQAEAYLDNLIFKNLRKYDLSKVGRHKVAVKLHHYLWKLAVRRDVMPRPDSRKHKHFALPSFTRRTLCLEDVIAAMQHLIALNCGITHLAEGQPKTSAMPQRGAQYEGFAEYKAFFADYAKKINGESLDKLALIDLHEKDGDDDVDVDQAGPQEGPLLASRTSPRPSRRGRPRCPTSSTATSRSSSTTSTISATAASAAWASCSRTRSASAWRRCPA